MTTFAASDWADSFFDDGYEETFRRLGKYDTTETDISNLLELVPIPASGLILDVPCGWGRHAGTLNAYGFRVVGVDASAAQIRRARQKWPDIEFHQCDMRAVPGSCYNTVLNLWTSFGSLPGRKDDLGALTQWHIATLPGGYLVMELTTREYAEAANRSNGEGIGRKSVTSNGVREDAIFDWKKGVSYNTYTCGDWSRTCITRLYTRPELQTMLRTAGYDEVHMYGGFTGEPIRDDARTVLVARKPL